MPPDRDIEFLIELLPGTGPISKRPYRMPANDLEEIKKQIKESEEKVKLIRDRLKVAQSRQKSYADSIRKEVVYEIGDRSYLRVSPLRGVKLFRVKGKLAPRFV